VGVVASETTRRPSRKFLTTEEIATGAS